MCSKHQGFIYCTPSTARKKRAWSEGLMMEVWKQNFRKRINVSLESNGCTDIHMKRKTIKNIIIFEPV
jgi:hypothetical protein